MKNRVSGEERSVFFTASTSIERAARRLNVLLALILAERGHLRSQMLGAAAVVGVVTLVVDRFG